MSLHGIIAVIEDPFICKLLRDLLARHGYQAVEFTARHAVELLQAGAHSIRLLITNQPTDFLPFARVLPVLYLAAAPDPKVAARFPSCRCVSKPFQAEELLTAVKELSEPE